MTISPDSCLPDRPVRRAVLLFARRPGEEARCKRLARGKRLFELGRDRVLTAAARLPEVSLIFLGDPGNARLPDGAVVLAQRGRDFGARLAQGFADAFGLGFDAVVAVGLDAPLLSSQHLDAAFQALDDTSVVLGPATDGGVYLLGLRSHVDRSALWRGVRWQTRSVLQQLRRNAPAQVLAEVLTDVDELADARRLAQDSRLDVEVRAALRLLLTPSWSRTAYLSPAPFRRCHLPLSRRGPPATQAA